MRNRLHQLRPYRQSGLGPGGLDRVSVVESNPHKGQDIRRIADKPGIPEVVGGAGLAGDWTRQVPTGKGPGGSFAHHTLEHVRHNIGLGRADQAFDIQVSLAQ